MWFNLINISIMGFEPLAIIILIILMPGGIPAITPLTGGIFATWLYTPMFWGVLSGEFKHRFPGINGKIFLLVNFGIPLGMGLLLRDTLWSILFELSTFHLFVLSASVFFSIFFCSLTDGDNSPDPLLGKFVVKKFPEKGHLLITLSKVCLYVGIWSWFLFIPPIWCELLYLETMGITFPLSMDQFSVDHLWLIVRYAAILVDIRIMFNVFYKLKFFDLSGWIVIGKGKEKDHVDKGNLKEVIQKVQKEMKWAWTLVIFSFLVCLVPISFYVIEKIIVLESWSFGWKVYLFTSLFGFLIWCYAYFKSLGLVPYFEEFGGGKFTMGFSIFLLFYILVIVIPGSIVVALILLPILYRLKIKTGEKSIRIAMPLAFAILYFSVILNMVYLAMFGVFK